MHPPELDFILSDVKNQDQREAVIASFHQMSGGDPKSIQVSFAVMILALTRKVETMVDKMGEAQETEIPELPSLKDLKKAVNSLELISRNYPSQGEGNSKLKGIYFLLVMNTLLILALGFYLFTLT